MKLRKRSWPSAGTVKDSGAVRMRSGWPSCHSEVYLGGVGAFGGDAFRHAGVNPALDLFEVFGGEAAIVGEVAVAGLGQPGRHEARLGDGEDLRGPAARVVVGEQAERAGAAGMMAGGAVVVEDGRDVARPGGRGVLARDLPIFAGLGRLGKCAYSGYEYGEENERVESSAALRVMIRMLDGPAG